MRHWFSNLTRRVSSAAGSWQASLASFTVIIAWLLGGFHFGFSSELYQLFINTFTTICTFLMVFLIQSAQNREMRALHLKADEIIHSLNKANNQLIDIENTTDEQIEQARQQVCSRKDEPSRSHEGNGP
jgi:low affinity Fe/Cu permease